jgi:hypothetical protein
VPDRLHGDVGLDVAHPFDPAEVFNLKAPVDVLSISLPASRLRHSAVADRHRLSEVSWMKDRTLFRSLISTNRSDSQL